MLATQVIHVMSYRSEVLSLYKQAIRLSKSWVSRDPTRIQTERQYIKTEAKRLITENRNLSDENQIKKLVEEGLNRLEVAKHYRIPYPRPVYYPTGASLQRRK